MNGGWLNKKTKIVGWGSVHRVALSVSRNLVTYLRWFGLGLDLLVLLYTREMLEDTLCLQHRVSDVPQLWAGHQEAHVLGVTNLAAASAASSSSQGKKVIRRPRRGLANHAPEPVAARRRHVGLRFCSVCWRVGIRRTSNMKFRGEEEESRHCWVPL